MFVKIESVHNHYLELRTDEEPFELQLEYSDVTATLISERARITLDIAIYPGDMVKINGVPDIEETIRRLMAKTLFELGA